MHPLSIVGMLLGLFMLYTLRTRYKRDEFVLLDVLLWGSVWCGLIFFSIFPDLLSHISKDWFEIQRPLDLIYIGCFLFSFGILYFLYRTIRRTERQLDLLLAQVKK